MQPSLQMHTPQKVQRNFHIDTEQYTLVITEDNKYDESLQAYGNKFSEYYKETPSQPIEDCTDIYFLDYPILAISLTTEES